MKPQKSFRSANQIGKGFSREVERHLRTVYDEFEKQLRVLHTGPNPRTVEDKLHVVRQFCKLLIDGEPVEFDMIVPRPRK